MEGTGRILQDVKLDIWLKKHVRKVLKEQSSSSWLLIVMCKKKGFKDQTIKKKKAEHKDLEKSHLFLLLLLRFSPYL